MAYNQSDAQTLNDAAHSSQHGEPQVRRSEGAGRAGIARRLRVGLTAAARTICAGIGSLTIVACAQPAATTPAPAPTPQNGLTTAKCEKLQPGMSYDEVTQILGNPNTRIFNSETPGYHVVTYMWGSDERSNVKVMFLNDRLLQKVEVGLQ
jgi:hypothetical protein